MPLFDRLPRIPTHRFQAIRRYQQLLELLDKLFFSVGQESVVPRGDDFVIGIDVSLAIRANAQSGDAETHGLKKDER
jgi:hypothetical protein